MGAADFMIVVKGRTAKDAFQQAVMQAQYDYGHSGYTGTIAEKHSFVLIGPPLDDLDQARDLANKLWGPAGCITTKDGRFLFFGWASS